MNDLIGFADWPKIPPLEVSYGVARGHVMSASECQFHQCDGIVALRWNTSDAGAHVLVLERVAFVANRPAGFTLTQIIGITPGHWVKVVVNDCVRIFDCYMRESIIPHGVYSPEEFDRLVMRLSRARSDLGVGAC